MTIQSTRRLDPERLGDHVDRLYRAAFGLCGSHHEAEDLVQETFARVLAKPRFLRREDDLGYLLRALRNTFYSRHRAAARRPIAVGLPDALEAVADHRTPPPEVLVEAREAYEAIATLAPHHRDVVVAVDLLGLTYAEAARALGIPQGTVMSRLFRARQQLARQLGVTRGETRPGNPSSALALTHGPPLVADE